MTTALVQGAFPVTPAQPAPTPSGRPASDRDRDTRKNTAIAARLNSPAEKQEIPVNRPPLQKTAVPRESASPVGKSVDSGPLVETRPYQQRIIARAVGYFRGQSSPEGSSSDLPAASVMVESPTGSGKTVMGLLIAREVQRQTGCRVGWVAMRRNLLAQARAENVSRQIGLDFKLISMFDRNPPKVDFLVVDEAQHDAAMSMAVLHSEVRPQQILGLTATPYRTDRLRLCFDHVIRDTGIHQLIQDGWLSHYHHYTIPAWKPEAVAECYCREPERWGKSLMFFHRSESCFECADHLRQNGVRCEVVTAASDRERQIASFLEGRCDVLLSMAILTEGFNCPRLKTVFCRPSGRGCTVQMAGRVFRLHPDLPFKQIVQCRETRHPFPRTAAPDEQYVWMDQQWQSLKLNRHIGEISQRSLAAIARATVEIPSYVSQRRSRSSLEMFRRERRFDPAVPR
ncbi:MAG: DEAD/DEAH box helicase family protein [Planctomycetaceae bacterium]|nr:DEAD/DEAH box helicase family protein [Planctomycetaceae bacterium]